MYLFKDISSSITPTFINPIKCLIHVPEINIQHEKTEEKLLPLQSKKLVNKTYTIEHLIPVLITKSYKKQQ